MKIKTLTRLESRHGQEPRKHSLIIAVQDATDTGEEGYPENLKVLDQGSGA